MPTKPTKKKAPVKKRRRPSRPTPKPKAIKRPAATKLVEAGSVILVPAKGTKLRGGGPGGRAWRIEVGGKRAGVVFINFIDEPPLGPHASIQIFLNAASQSRQIGRSGYRKACEASQYDVIYAHMRKSNVASARAAAAAGFVDATPEGAIQKTMCWRRRPAPS
jgi:hypothetical protein